MTLTITHAMDANYRTVDRRANARARKRWPGRTLELHAVEYGAAFDHETGRVLSVYHYRNA